MNNWALQTGSTHHVYVGCLPFAIGFIFGNSGHIFRTLITMILVRF